MSDEAFLVCLRALEAGLGNDLARVYFESTSGSAKENAIVAEFEARLAELCGETVDLGGWLRIGFVREGVGPLLAGNKQQDALWNAMSNSDDKEGRR